MGKLILLTVIADKYGHTPDGSKTMLFDSSLIELRDYTWIVDADVADPDCDDKHIAFAGDKGSNSVDVLSTKTLKIKYLEEYFFVKASKVQIADLAQSCCKGANAAPTVTLAVDDDDITAGTQSTFTATAADGDGSIAKVEFWEGESKLGEDTLTAFTLAITLSKGVHFIVAKAIDNNGAFAYSSWVRVIVR